MKHNFDKILLQIGPFGKYQLTRFFLLCIPAAFCCPYASLLTIFLIFNPQHRCVLPQSQDLPVPLSNFTEKELIDILIPKDETGDIDGCSIRNASQVADPNFEGEISISPCPNGLYYEPGQKWLITAEFGMVCNQKYLARVVQSVGLVGQIIGTLVLSNLQDKYGRKPTLFIGLAVYIIFGAASALMPNITLYIIFRFIAQTPALPFFQIPYVLALEMVGPEKHTFVVNGMSLIFAFCASSLSLIGYLCTTWQQVILVTTVPFIILFVYWFLIDESPRWLLSQGKYEAAGKIIEKMARENGNPLSQDQLDTLLLEGAEDLDEEKATAARKLSIIKGEEPAAPIEDVNFISMWKHCNIVWILLTLSYIWSVNAMVYIGVNLSVDSFGVDPYLMFALICWIEMPAAGFNFIVNKVGRIWPCAMTMIVSGLALLGTTFSPPQLVVAILAIIGKFCITASFCIIYQLGGELFPTVIRATGIGFASVISQIFTVLTPFIVFSATAIPTLPMMIFGILSFTGGLLTCFLPETLNHKLPEAISDMEHSADMKFGVATFRGNVSTRTARERRRRLV